jgi:ferredoxin
MARISIPGSGIEVESSPAHSILNALLRNGVEIRHDCGGKALCGTCRLRVVSGSSGLSPIGPREAERLAAIASAAGQGGEPGSAGLAGELRLACQTHAARDAEVEILLGPRRDGA